MKPTAEGTEVSQETKISQEEVHPHHDNKHHPRKTPTLLTKYIQIKYCLDRKFNVNQIFFHVDAIMFYCQVSVPLL